MYYIRFLERNYTLFVVCPLNVIKSHQASTTSSPQKPNKQSIYLSFDDVPTNFKTIWQKWIKWPLELWMGPSLLLLTYFGAERHQNFTSHLSMIWYPIPTFPPIHKVVIDDEQTSNNLTEVDQVTFRAFKGDSNFLTCLGYNRHPNFTSISISKLVFDK